VTVSPVQVNGLAHTVAKNRDHACIVVAHRAAVAVLLALPLRAARAASP